MKFGVVVFPGTWSDVDCFHVIKDCLDQDVEYIWHKDTDLSKFDCIILPGGFSYGDYLRCGAIAKFSPVMESIKEFSEKGKAIIGICNGFQILCESGILPGVLIRNRDLKFRCEMTNLLVQNTDTVFTNRCDLDQVIQVPISHGEGNYFVDNDTLNELEKNNQILFSYSSSIGEVSEINNPNGSVMNIAGIVNQKGNVLGMMPHPERVCDPILGGTDGLKIFGSILDHFSDSVSF
ncbi:MAG: phosphoribosylformylglycinamidine synthase subunit PurQ [SAR202 cluster bacterium]|nr:phosphoribosylformylglycinamidine synthase subunit PurQ [SAR202 cluster bacterium]|tara:strand:+ start:7683 stop:8387 length:705 start_codon:yes stop_codon:yes gene_type:complete